jgi:hypothetical protein
LSYWDIYILNCKIFIHALFAYRRRVSTSTASQQQVHPLHWSRRATTDNPHGFTDKVLTRLRAIEDPAEREKEEKKLLDARRKYYVKQGLDPEDGTRVHEP